MKEKEKEKERKRFFRTVFRIGTQHAPYNRKRRGKKEIRRRNRNRNRRRRRRLGRRWWRAGRATGTSWARHISPLPPLTSRGPLPPLVLLLPRLLPRFLFYNLGRRSWKDGKNLYSHTPPHHQITSLAAPRCSSTTSSFLSFSLSLSKPPFFLPLISISIFSSYPFHIMYAAFIYIYKDI